MRKSVIAIAVALVVAFAGAAAQVSSVLNALQRLASVSVQ